MMLENSKVEYKHFLDFGIFKAKCTRLPVFQAICEKEVNKEEDNYLNKSISN